MRLWVLCLVGLACSNKKTDENEAFVYRPPRCDYAVTPSERRGFTDIVLDGPRAAAPQRVRVGLGGGTEWGAPGYADPKSSLVFTWETAETSTAAKVRLGTSADSLSDVRTGYSWITPP